MVIASLRIVLLALFIVEMSVASAFSQEKKTYTLAILDLVPNGISQVEAIGISDKLRIHVSRLVRSSEYLHLKGREWYTVIERTQMDKVLDQYNIRNFCGSDSCAVELGKLLQADRIIIGTISLVGETYSVTSRIVDVETGKSIAEADRQYKGSIDEVLNRIIVKVGNELFFAEVKGYRFIIRRDGPLLLGAGSGIAAIFFKIKANRFYEDQKTADDLEAWRKAKYDTKINNNISNVLGGISVVSLGFSLYKFLKGKKIEGSDNSLGVRTSFANGMKVALVKKF